MLLSVLLAGSSLACGVDTDSQRPDSGWRINEDSSANNRPEGLPDQYIDHPIAERRFDSPTGTQCDVPTEYETTPGIGEQFHRPLVGVVALFGLHPLEYDPTPVEPYNYNLFIRLPKKSDRWHRFEMRPSGPDGAYRTAWGNTSEPRIYVRTTGLVIAISLAMNGCQLPTQADVDRFVSDFEEIQLVFHNPETDKTFRFEPDNPGAVLLEDPTVVLYGSDPAILTWDLPLNRPQQPIPGFLRPQPR